MPVALCATHSIVASLFDGGSHSNAFNNGDLVSMVRTHADSHLVGCIGPLAQNL
jgi:hypothetical protein